MSATKPDITFFLEKISPREHMLFACRGEGKGCKRNVTRTTKASCEDCVKADRPNETLGEFKARLERGDA